MIEGTSVGVALVISISWQPSTTWSSAIASTGSSSIDNHKLGEVAPLLHCALVLDSLVTGPYEISAEVFSSGALMFVHLTNTNSSYRTRYH